MSKEAMKLALEALENSRSLEPVDVQWVKGKRHAAITALREALAEQPAQQEPFGFAVMENPIAPPAQRTWVGLTDEELREFDVDPIEAKLMIAKLKEKNT